MFKRKYLAIPILIFLAALVIVPNINIGPSRVNAEWSQTGAWDTIKQLLGVAHTWTAPQTFTSTTSPYVTITYGATVDFDWDSGNNQQVELAGDPTFTFSNIPDGAWLKVRIVQDGTGSRTVTWPGTAKWPGGIEPTLTTTGAAIDILSFVSDGTNLEAFGFAADVK